MSRDINKKKNVLKNDTSNYDYVDSCVVHVSYLHGKTKIYRLYIPSYLPQESPGR